MKILFYSVKDFEEYYLHYCNNNTYDIRFTSNALSLDTVKEAEGFEIISIFTGDDASSSVLEGLQKAGVKFIAVRATGYDNVDIAKAGELGINVANVPEYSPYAIATPHQAFATTDALNNIANTTFYNIFCWVHDKICDNELTTPLPDDKKTVQSNHQRHVV